MEARPSFLTPNARTAFNCLQLAFIKAPIFWHFNPEYYIWIEIDALDYAIGRVLSQLTSGICANEVVNKANLGQWYLVAFFSRKMILIKIQYKTHNGKLLAIIEIFKTWHYYLKSYKH